MSGVLEACRACFGTQDLYMVLGLDSNASPNQLKKAYHKVSLRVHPDRVSQDEKQEATHKFQTLGKVYCILADADKRAVYDETGEVDEENVAPEDRDWDQYWRLLFKKITVEDIKNFEDKYRESEEELADLKQAYVDGEGSMDYILENVLCATIDDETRFRKTIDEWIKKEDVPEFDNFTKESKKKKDNRKRKVTTSAKRRKVARTCRVFRAQWTEKYFFVERFGQAQCLICLKSVAAFTKLNILRHWKTKHRASSYASMSATERRVTIARLMGNLQKSTSLSSRQTTEAEKVMRATYEVSYLISRHMKPVSDGDFIRECVLAVVDCICPEQRSVFERVCLSPHTIRRCISELSDNLRDSLRTRCSTLVTFSLALILNTDTKDEAQLAISIRGVTADLQVCEELLQVFPLHDTTSGQDVCNAVLCCVSQFSLDLSRLVCITTDGAPGMTGENGAAALLLRHCEAAGHNQPIHKMHCILQQEALCAKSSCLVDVMSVVLKVVDSILSGSSLFPEFQTLVDEVSANCSDPLFFSEVRWLSHGPVLSLVIDLQQEIREFLHPYNLPYINNFDNPRWLARLALLTDVTVHLNTLSMKLQGRDVLVTDVLAHITAFKAKLCLWEAQLADGQLVHFPHLAACHPQDVDADTCVSVVASLREELALCFVDVRSLAADCKLFTAPFDFPVADAPAHLQMELMELQCNDELKAKYRMSSPLSFFRDVILPSSNFPEYIAHVQCIVAMFGSTHCHEQVFSKMKYVKPRLHSEFSGCHLRDILMLSMSSVEPDIESLLHGKQQQQQPSH